MKTDRIHLCPGRGGSGKGLWTKALKAALEARPAIRRRRRQLP